MQAQTTLLVSLASFLLFSFSVAHAESGLASYYRYAKAGKDGELACAHRTRPFGSVLKVSYSGRTIQCRVNDRGPFIRGRIVDLSVPAARALGMMSAGVVRVLVE
ncbi:septal ring lytic transglycosylase RlpA family protein [Bradyrhizobium sp. CCBAU 25338]|uniref:septal ring lytic transglycosylase RlpA family protein n=1 Tax=Bradyrhizobium sp. CCBAU 25338 TaxID=1641877 RepID=UPI00230249D6|nr:septal ring lytic transglycosylase RlpA family protein [Bradyrhizobium sp. CCBAU 25338]MDA9531983.1 lipoprotein [Bradyrhizobium sp. CCBAU 25338]